MIRRPPRSTLDRSSAASDVYKRQLSFRYTGTQLSRTPSYGNILGLDPPVPVSYTHLRAHETGRKLVRRLLLEKKKHVPRGDPRLHHQRLDARLFGHAQ